MSGNAKTSASVTAGVTVKGCPMRPDDDGVVGRQAEHLELVESGDLVQPDHDEVDVAGPQPVRQLTPRGDDARMCNRGWHACSRPTTGATSTAPPHGPTPIRSSPSSRPFVRRTSRSRSRAPASSAIAWRRTTRAHLGELDAARAAVEEPRADLGFQRLDAARQGRLREVASGRGPHDRAVLGDGDEVAEPTKIHSHA